MKQSWKPMKHVVAFVISTCLIVPPAAYADDVKYLDPGEKAPFAGYLITPEKAQKVRDNDIDLQTCNKINLALVKEQGISDIRQEKALAHMETLSDAAFKNTNFPEKVGYFLLGALVTGAIAYATVKTLR